jgi:hypothetical protein
MIKLGSKVRDIVNGFEGIATGRAEYLTGCTQYLVAPQKTDKDGKVTESYWLDEGRLVVLAAPTKAVAAIGTQPTVAAGGPQRDAPRGRR